MLPWKLKPNIPFQNWSSDLLQISTNILQLNASPMTFLRKIHTKICLSVDVGGKIPVKAVTKAFTANKDDKKRVEKALGDATGMNVTKVF